VPAQDVIVEDAPDDLGLWFEDDEVGGTVRAAGDASIAVGGLPGDHLSCSRAIELAAPIALGDLGALVFGDDALNLGEQTRLGIVVDLRGIREQHPHAMACKFVQHDDLIGVGARETIRRQTPHRVEQPCLRGVAQGVKPRPVQTSTGMSVVQKFGGDLMALLGRAGAQDFEL
jgi:hypothetical protein